MVRDMDSNNGLVIIGYMSRYSPQLMYKHRWWWQLLDISQNWQFYIAPFDFIVNSTVIFYLFNSSPPPHLLAHPIVVSVQLIVSDNLFPSILR